MVSGRSEAHRHLSTQRKTSGPLTNHQSALSVCSCACAAPMFLRVFLSAFFLPFQCVSVCHPCNSVCSLPGSVCPHLRVSLSKSPSHSCVNLSVTLSVTSAVLSLCVPVCLYVSLPVRFFACASLSVTASVSLYLFLSVSLSSRSISVSSVFICRYLNLFVCTSLCVNFGQCAHVCVSLRVCACLHLCSLSVCVSRLSPLIFSLPVCAPYPSRCPQQASSEAEWRRPCHLARERESERRG